MASDDYVRTFDGKLAEVNSIIAMLNKLAINFKDAKKFEAAEFKRGVRDLSELKAAITGKFEGSAGVMSGEVTDSITGFLLDSVTWKVTLYKEIMLDSAAWTSVAVDSAAKTLTINQVVTTVIFTGLFRIDDIIEITNAEDPTNNGFHTIATIAAQTLTMDDAIGTDNTTDETMIISLHRYHTI